MAKEILFASKKGGTGKSTLCAMVANHLAYNGMKVAVIDCDNCFTLTWRRKSDLKNLPEGESPEYLIFQDEDYLDKEHLLEGYDYVLIDNYDLFKENFSGIIVVPFIYTEMILDSTFRFVRNMKKLPDCEVMFVPNEVNGYKQSIKKKDIIETINWILCIFGKILPKVSNSRLMDQVNTVANSVEQNLLIKDFIDALLPECPMTEDEILLSSSTTMVASQELQEDTENDPIEISALDQQVL